MAYQQHNAETKLLLLFGILLLAVLAEHGQLTMLASVRRRAIAITMNNSQPKECLMAVFSLFFWFLEEPLG